MAKKALFALFAIFIMLCFTPGAGLAKSKIDLANDYITINRHQEAHAQLNAAILADPVNAEIHYQAGLAYARMGRQSQANECFANAFKLKPMRYARPIQDHYINQGFNFANQGQVDRAIKAFEQALAMKANRTEISSRLMDKGVASAEQNYFKDAYYYFKTAYALEPNLGGKISDVYFETCNSRPRPCFNFYRRAHEFSTKHDQEIVQILMALYKTDGLVDHQKQAIKQEIKYYVSNETFNQLFPPPPPDYKIYPPSPKPYFITLKAGEITDKWITIPSGTRIAYMNGIEDKFIFIYPDGTKKEAWKLKRMPNKYKFKLQAVVSQKVEFKVE